MMDDVAVIIGTYNARDTLARAISSALQQPEVSEVIVVDDASTDDSVAVALAADDGSGRLILIRQPVNQGPAAARNIAIARSKAAYVAVLDADDFLLPGRFAALLAEPDWDMIADNIVFMREDAADGFDPLARRSAAGKSQIVSLESFIRRNISSRSEPRGELGFLKPVIRRSFLDDAGLRYDETLRLGEDYVFYCRALAAGACLRLSRHCGYVAIERAQSLSGSHRTADLFALASADDRLLQLPDLSPGERSLLIRHRRQILAKANHRRFLDDRRRTGMVAATMAFVRRPATLAGIARDVVRDKIEAWRPGSSIRPPALRYLLD